MMESTLNRLKDISQKSSQLFEDILTNQINSKFDNLCETTKQNIDLLEEIEDKHQNRLKTIIAKSKITIDNKESNQLNEKDLSEELIALNSSLKSLNSELITKKQDKTQVKNKTIALIKHLNELKAKEKEMREQNSSTEGKQLESVMRVVYKTLNNSKVIGLFFNDNEEKSLDRLMVIDEDIKSEEQMVKQFWESLEKDYQIDNQF